MVFEDRESRTIVPVRTHCPAQCSTHRRWKNSCLCSNSSLAVVSAVFPASSDSSFDSNRDRVSCFSIGPGLSSNTSDATPLPSSLVPISEPRLMSNCTTSSSSTVVTGMAAFLTIQSYEALARISQKNIGYRIYFRFSKTIVPFWFVQREFWMKGRETKFKRGRLGWTWIPFRKFWVVKVS